jgi:hypothetical protein
LIFSPDSPGLDCRAPRPFYQALVLDGFHLWPYRTPGRRSAPAGPAKRPSAKPQRTLAPDARTSLWRARRGRQPHYRGVRHAVGAGDIRQRVTALAVARRTLMTPAERLSSAPAALVTGANGYPAGSASDTTGRARPAVATHRHRETRALERPILALAGPERPHAFRHQDQ